MLYGMLLKPDQTPSTREASFRESLEWYSDVGFKMDLCQVHDVVSKDVQVLADIPLCPDARDIILWSIFAQAGQQSGRWSRVPLYTPAGFDAGFRICQSTHKGTVCGTVTDYYFLI